MLSKDFQTVLSFIQSFLQGLVFRIWVVLCFNSTFTLLLWQDGKGELMAARCKGMAGQGTWQVSDLIPFPSGQHTSSVWQSIRKQVPMSTWPSTKIWQERTEKHKCCIIFYRYFEVQERASSSNIFFVSLFLIPLLVSHTLIGKISTQKTKGVQHKKRDSAHVGPLQAFKYTAKLSHKHSLTKSANVCCIRIQHLIIGTNWAHLRSHVKCSSTCLFDPKFQKLRIP